MKADSERDISKVKSEGDCRARSAGGWRRIAAMGAVEVAGGGKWRGIADAWRCNRGLSPLWDYRGLSPLWDSHSLLFSLHISLLLRT